MLKVVYLLRDQIYQILLCQHRLSRMSSKIQLIKLNTGAAHRCCFSNSPCYEKSIDLSDFCHHYSFHIPCLHCAIIDISLILMKSIHYPAMKGKSKQICHYMTISIWNRLTNVESNWVFHVCLYLNKFMQCNWFFN